MNYFAVPDFEMEDDQRLLSTSSSITRHKSVDEEMMELFWQDGQVVAQPQQQQQQQQQQQRKSQSSPSTTLAPTNHQHHHQQQQQHLYMAEDEMANWLHYPPTEDLYSDLLCDSSHHEQTPSHELPQAATTGLQPPMNRPLMAVPPPSSVVPPAPQPNFPLFSRMRGKGKEVNIKPESMTVVGSNNTTTTNMRSVGGEVSSAFPSRVGGETLVDPAGGGSGNTTMSSSSGTSGGGFPATTAPPPSTTSFDEMGNKVVVKSDTEDRNRKRIRTSSDDDSNAAPTPAADQDVELEADEDGKKHSRGSHSSKRSRAAEVHNLSERRRRDRINEKMKALQELIPRCNKSDKASMLDEVIEYLKSLQMQVQMMSMGCGMMPMVYPGMHQQFTPPMGMDMGMNRPVMPFPPNLPGSTFPTTPTTPTATAAAQFAPNFSIPSVRMPSIPSPSGSNFSVNQSSIQADSVRSSYPVPTPGMPQMPNLSDPYQQFMTLQQMQMQMQMQMQLQMQMQMQAAQNQSSQPGSSKPSTGKSETQTGPSTSKSEAEDDP